MRMFVPMIALATLSGCSNPPVPPGAALAHETAGLIAGPPQNCVGYTAGEGIRIVDSQTLAYGWGRSVYINHLGSPCPGVHPTSTLIVEPALANQYCQGDRVRGHESGSAIPGPVCILGDWVPYRRP